MIDTRTGKIYFRDNMKLATEFLNTKPRVGKDNWEPGYSKPGKNIVSQCLYHLIDHPWKKHKGFKLEYFEVDVCTELEKKYN